MKKDKPEIRFSSFKSMWMEQKFNDVLKSYSYRPYLKTSYENGIYPVIQQGENPILGFSNGEPFKNYRDVILFGDHTLSVYKPQMPFFVATDGVKILSARGIDGEFLTPLFEKYVPKSQGYKRHYTILKNEFISYPHEVEEQIKIGSFFKNIDETISFHQQELDALKQTKQGFLQKMFPKNGEVVPVLRFESFNTNWKKDQLGSIAEVTKLAGFEFTKYVKYSDKGQIPAIRGLNVKNGRFIFNDVKFIDESNFIKLKRSNLEEGDIVFTYVGTVGEAAIVPRNVNWYLAPNVSRIRTDKLYPEYLLQLLMHPSFKQKEIVSRISTSSQPALSMENIRKFELLIPSYEEQIKIGEFFRQLDEVIELKEKELEAVKETKNGFLQKMFV